MQYDCKEFHTHTHTIGTVKRKGFTIIQLAIGMLIFAILTGIAFFGISIYTAQANETRVASDLGTFEVAIKDYMLNNPGACSNGTLSPVGLNHYLTKENTLALDETDPNKDDLGSEISVAAGVKSEAAYKKLSVLEDPWGHQYRVVIRNNADRTTEEGEYGAKGTDRAFIYVYSMGKDGKGAANDTKQDDSVLCVQYSDGEVYSRSYLPSDGKNQAITAPAYTYWNKDQNGKHSVMKDSIFAVGGADPSKAPGKENSGSGGSGSSGSGGAAPGGSQIRANLIPDGATYMFDTMNGGEVREGNGVNVFPDTPGQYDAYFEGNYVYLYGFDTQEINNETYAFGNDWAVMSTTSFALLNEENDVQQLSSYGTILESIAGKPVTYMTGTYAGCTELVAVEPVPDGIEMMMYTYAACPKLTTAPTIPDSVTMMLRTFLDDAALEIAPTLPTNLMASAGIFEGCSKLKTYAGSKDADGDFSGYAIPNQVINTVAMFSGCDLLTDAPALPTNIDIADSMFENCKSLINAPVLPDGIDSIDGMFCDCTSLATAPIIPGSVRNMPYVFNRCVSLTGAVVINSTMSQDISGCFAGTKLPITLCGASTRLVEYAETAENGNVTVG